MRQTKNNTAKDTNQSNRQLRVAELVRRTIADILTKNELYEESLANILITVSEVRCSGDLKLATVFVLPLGGKNTKEVIKSLAKHKNKIRKILGQNLNLKFVPDLRFKEDETFDQIEQTTKLFLNPKVQRDVLN